MDRVKGSSLLEAILAMTVLTLVLGITAISIGYTIQSNTSNLKLKAKLEFERIKSDTYASGNFFDETYDLGIMMIEKKLIPAPSAPSLAILSLEAYKPNGTYLILKQKEWIYATR